MTNFSFCFAPKQTNYCFPPDSLPVQTGTSSGSNAQWGHWCAKPGIGREVPQLHSLPQTSWRSKEQACLVEDLQELCGKRGSWARWGRKDECFSGGVKLVGQGLCHCCQPFETWLFESALFCCRLGASGHWPAVLSPQQDQRGEGEEAGDERQEEERGAGEGFSSAHL